MAVAVLICTLTDVVNEYIPSCQHLAMGSTMALFTVNSTPSPFVNSRRMCIAWKQDGGPIKIFHGCNWLVRLYEDKEQVHLRLEMLSSLVVCSLPSAMKEPPHSVWCFRRCERHSADCFECNSCHTWNSYIPYSVCTSIAGGCIGYQETGWVNFWLLPWLNT